MALEKYLEPIERLRKESALVHCVLNTVAQNFTANVLLCCGATPSMTTSKEEIKEFAAFADALLINLGTLDEEKRTVCRLAVEAAKTKSIPFVLDPVMCNISQTRLKFAEEQLALSPKILRVNKQEAKSLETIASDQTCTVITGETDLVMVGRNKASVSNGHPYMHKVIAVGCAQGAVMAALYTKANSAFDAAVGTLLWFGVAGEMAAEKASGPGSFQTAFIDTLSNLSTSQIADKARVDETV